MNPPIRHDQDEPIDIYISPQAAANYARVHCLHCGLPMATIRARIVRVFDASNSGEIQVGVGGMCRRCKATYRFVFV